MLEMLAASKGKALFHLAFVSTLDPCSSHHRRAHRKGKATCPAATGQFWAGTPWVLSNSMLLLAVYEVAALGQFLGDLVCARAPTSLTAEPAPNCLGDELCPSVSPPVRGWGAPVKRRWFVRLLLGSLGVPCSGADPSVGEEEIFRSCVLGNPTLKYTEFGSGLW